LKDLAGTLDSILANDNAEGQFYVQVSETDQALETRCDLRFLRVLPEIATVFPDKIEPGMYLVGIEIQPGTYRGQAGTEFSDSCYWQRLRNLSGSFGAIIANDNATGQFYVKVSQTDVALSTRCELARVGD
jgi:hypothetical protein